MVAQSKKTAGLGKSLIKNRFKTNQGMNGARMKQNPDGSVVKHTTEFEDSQWNKMSSVTQENDLEAFLNTATLAGTDFVAEKLNVQVITRGQKNPYLLSVEEEQETLQKHRDNQAALRVPRRPVWDGIAKPEEQQRRERESFLEWRRGLVALEEEEGLLMTPYERNIEVWRQLWRVIERSDIVIQIVDARNPLLFRCADVDTYVSEVDPRKKCIMLVNKADMLTPKQRKMWADYFDSVGVRYMFFSAALARKKLEEEAEREKEEIERVEREEKEREVMEELRRMGLDVGLRGGRDGRKGGDLHMLNQIRDEDAGEEEEEESEEAGVGEEQATKGEQQEVVEEEEEDVSEEEGEEEVEDEESQMEGGEGTDEEEDQFNIDGEMVGGIHMSNNWRRGRTDDEEPLHVRILTIQELLDRIALECPAPLHPSAQKVTVGFVGYPNVGKSSTLNALVGAKKVTVSATPGKTKHFQTIHLDSTTVLCDCPGLVFPSFATTKADMVVNGILPIDQLREHTGPAQIVAQRVPREVLQGIYGIVIKTLDAERNIDLSLPVGGEDLCQAFAVARGFRKAAQGNPDEARAARYILKDYVNGKILYCEPPPNLTNPAEFIKETYPPEDLLKYSKPQRVQTHETAPDPSDPTTSSSPHHHSSNDILSHSTLAQQSRTTDAEFFDPKSMGAAIKGKFASGGFTRVKMYPHQVGALATAGEGSHSSSFVSKKGKGKAKAAPSLTAPPAMGFGLEDPKSKKHKKVKRGKVRVNWTADERAD
ncbi:hypothetical protein HDV05_002201 [Chytridiales sp. JEL 0842]|nr:hypothetical protein HDV05_002201 [Chytridiales sp. JEL 0842]